MNRRDRTNPAERSLEYGFGILGGALVLVGALIGLAVAVFDPVSARGGAFAAGTEAAALALLALFFA